MMRLLNMSESPLKYHEGEIAVQKRAGAFDPADLDGNGLGTELDARAATFLAQQLWVIVAGLDSAGRVWTSPLYGPAGFLQVNDAKTLAVHASLPVDDPSHDSFQRSNEIGLLVLDPRTRRRMRINGRAEPRRDGTLLVTTREVFGNCPKYIQRREITGAIAAEENEAIEAPALTTADREQITGADTFFIGSLHTEAGLDCSHRGGNPGFVRVLSERKLAFPDYSGNNMFQTLGNLSLDSRAGLLFLDFETGRTLQLTGSATILWDAAALREWPGAHRVVEFEIVKDIARERALPLRWRLIDYSPANPH
jgi:predicted pyridoxine 5'-phosphate oxidase superfamily flavin-nucleotide-binding protein